MATYYELPIDFLTLTKPNHDLATCELKKSIAQNIILLITSKCNEHRFDNAYGCEIWDMDFELILNERIWLEKVSGSILRSLKKHEHRLENIAAVVNISEEEFVHSTTGIRGIRKKITVLINGQVKETGELFRFSTNLFLSPISFD